MSGKHDNLSETHIIGDDTHQCVVRADTNDPRPWLQEARVCNTLGLHQIAHVGIANAKVPYRVVRKDQSGTYLLACFGGRGKVLIDGRWQVCAPGTACLLPPHTMNAFYATSECRWQFCWVRYAEPPEKKPIIAATSPVIAKFDSLPLRHAVEGLYHECGASNSPSALHHWVELIQSYVLQFAQPWQGDDRLWRLWHQVVNELDQEWTLDRLASISHVSSEHLRRLCRRQLGRSPMQQVTFMRMQRAAELLSTNNDKIEVIAASVGYQNPFVFSTTFKKWIGWRPSEFRAKQNASAKRR